MRACPHRAKETTAEPETDENGETIPETTTQGVEDEVIPYEDGLGIPDRMPGIGAAEPASSSGTESSASSEPDETASEEET